jgi:hypothetical protein
MASMSSLAGVLSGVQAPRVSHVPAFSSSAGDEAVDLARMAGLSLDPWQEWVLRMSLGERPDGRWAAREVGVVVPRQNGKGALLEARELAGLFLLGEGFITHSAHQFDTSKEHYRRLKDLISETPEFHARVKPRGYKESHGEEGIELRSGQRIRFRTRTKGGGRGFSGDLLVLDEAMDLPLSAHGALLPTLSARPNPQIWYTGSAVDQNVHEHGLVLTRVRSRGTSGDDDGLLYAEWSADGDIDDLRDVLDDEGAWATANPGLGIRIDRDTVALERRSMDPRTFAVERLGVGDWPDLEDLDRDDRIDSEAWEACVDVESRVSGPKRFAVDVRPDRQASAICVAGYRPDGRRHVEVVEHKAHTRWVPERARELQQRHQAGPILLDQRGPAASLIKAFVEAGVRFEAVGAQEHAQGAGILFDGVDERAIRHLDQPTLTAAARGAVKKSLGDQFTWSRRNSAVDISPLVAVTLALYGLPPLEQAPYFMTFTPEELASA